MDRRVHPGQPAATQEVGDRFGIKASSAFGIVRALQKKGYLAASDGTARSLAPIDLAEASAAGIDVRLRRLVPTSASIAEVRGFGGSIRPALKHGADRPLFMVTVRGDSLIEAGIFDGDTAIVRQQDRAEEGDLVVASAGFEATIRRLYYDDAGNALLAPENRAYETTTVAASDLVVYGKVVAVYRDID